MRELIYTLKKKKRERGLNGRTFSQNPHKWGKSPHHQQCYVHIFIMCLDTTHLFVLSMFDCTNLHTFSHTHSFYQKFWYPVLICNVQDTKLGWTFVLKYWSLTGYHYFQVNHESHIRMKWKKNSWHTPMCCEWIEKKKQLNELGRQKLKRWNLWLWLKLCATVPSQEIVLFITVRLTFIHHMNGLLCCVLKQCYPQVW